MEGKMLARIGAVVFVAVAITATAIEMVRKDDAPEMPFVGNGASVPADPLAAELVRCQHLGEAGTRDTRCLQVWAENRDRFLGANPRHDDAQTAVPAIPDSPVGREAAPASVPDTTGTR